MNQAQKILLKGAVTLAVQIAVPLIEGAIANHKEKKRLIEENIFVLPPSSFTSIH